VLGCRRWRRVQISQIGSIAVVVAAASTSVRCRRTLV
jgi:hypothetical protein